MGNPPDGTEQADERRRGADGSKHRQAILQTRRFLVDDLADGASHEGASRPFFFELQRAIFGMVVACMDGMAGHMRKRLIRAVRGDFIFDLLQRAGCPALVPKLLRTAAYEPLEDRTSVV